MKKMIALAVNSYVASAVGRKAQQSVPHGNVLRNPGDFGNSSELHGRVAAAEGRGSRNPAVGSAAAATSNELLKK